MNKEMIEKYFERIGLTYNENEPLDSELLKKLQYAHVTSVPYETTQIVDRVPLSLETDDLYKKIVTERRGGYCFELNGLFGELLRALGFEVHEYSARFLRGEKEPPKPRHRVLAVTTNEGRFLCDVGVGSKAPRHPLLMEVGVEQNQFGEAYRFEKDDFLGWVIWERNDGIWEQYFSFTECEHLNKDFYTLSYYCENHPDSPFLNNMLSIKTDIGRITIDKNIFKVWKNNSISSEKLLNDDELEKYCEKYFGLSLHINK